MRLLLSPVLLALAACSGVALNTTVASTPASRAAMAAFVVPGTTTETDVTTRWGNPVQKVRRGAQTEFVYRDMRNPPGTRPFPNFGTSSDYVIVTFQYGLAVGVRTSDGIACRGTFPPRPPNFPLDNPTRVELVGACRTGALAPGFVASDALPSGEAGKAPK